mmetsp:Transcript_58889/g.140075  ORF Transcript_58889/g.140075 Transcript_58889/m.140075 type:complete len:242 (-) Transcript_58889:143-868(-)
MPADASAPLLMPFCDSCPNCVAGKSVPPSAVEPSSCAGVDVEGVFPPAEPRRERLELAPARGGLGACSRWERPDPESSDGWRIACSLSVGAFGPPVLKPDSPPPHRRDSGDWGISNSVEALLVSSVGRVSRTGSFASPSPKRSFINIESLSRFITGSSMAPCWRTGWQGPFTSTFLAEDWSGTGPLVDQAASRSAATLLKSVRQAPAAAGPARTASAPSGAQKRGVPLRLAPGASVPHASL